MLQNIQYQHIFFNHLDYFDLTQFAYIFSLVLANLNDLFRCANVTNLGSFLFQHNYPYYVNMYRYDMFSLLHL